MTPSAVHPKTGRVCVPIDPANVRDFDPFVVPTLGQLQRQIDQYDKDHGEEVGGGSGSGSSGVGCGQRSFPDPIQLSCLTENYLQT